MRGKADSSAQAEESSRITPAYAGKSRTVCGIRSKLEDHPRLCGEKLDAVTVLISTLGSPPPMRGKVVRCFGCRSKRRITPAYAGKSLFPPFLRQCPEDHPRLCGEKFVWRYVNYEEVGSPPPMRGKEEHRAIARAEQGITPAYAGKSK